MTHFSSYYNQQQQERQQLERIYRRSHRSVYLVHQVQQWLVNVSAQTVMWLTQDRNQPRISQVQTQLGESRWVVYDPMRQAQFSFESEQDVRTWMETRYYR